MFQWFKQQKRIADLEETVEKLVRDEKNRELEWENTYDKFRLLYVRLSKRVSQLKDSDVMPEGAQPGVGDESSGELSPSLTPRQQQVQLAIMARRRKVG